MKFGVADVPDASSTVFRIHGFEVHRTLHRQRS